MIAVGVEMGKPSSAHDRDLVPRTTHFTWAGCYGQLPYLNFHWIKWHHDSSSFPPGCTQHWRQNGGVIRSQISQALGGNAVAGLSIRRSLQWQSLFKVTFVESSPKS